ncbi:hypothetical protein EG68_01404 [Paragonimus skrjabini miyazakii]|uniref:Uncharacterized protein n=1 Tax=Paragonimus skrjabini miyazakii TaxID=59628 RepID=A0A8S9Z6H2_9TREM|nr:hypothetical protein EG68_01404 [Paragonimus skrjabini miyazakii]
MENTLTATSNPNNEVNANASDVSDSEDPNRPGRVEEEPIQIASEQPHSSMNESSTHHEQIDSDLEVHEVRRDKDEALTPDSPLDVEVEKGSGSEAMGATVQHHAGYTIEEHQKSDMLSESSIDATSQQPANTIKEGGESLVIERDATADHTEEEESTVHLDQAQTECKNETFGKPQPQTETCTYGENQMLSANENLPEDSRSLQNEENMEFKTDVIKPSTEIDSDFDIVHSEQQEANPDSPVEPLDQRINILSELTSNTDVGPINEEIISTDGGDQTVLSKSKVIASTVETQSNAEILSSLNEPEASPELSQLVKQAEISNGIETSEVIITDFEPSSENLISEVHWGNEDEMQVASVHELNAKFLKTDQKESGFVYAEKDTETVNLESVEELSGQSNECIAVEHAPSPISSNMIGSSPPEVLAAYETSLPELKDSVILPDVPATDHVDEGSFLETSPTELSDVILSNNEQTSEDAQTKDVENEHLHQAEQHIVHESMQPELCDQIPEDNFKVAKVTSTGEPSLITTEHVVFSELHKEGTPAPIDIQNDAKTMNLYQHPGDENQSPNGYGYKSNGPIEQVQRELSQDIQRRPLSDVKQRSKTLEPHIMASWMDHYLDPKKRSATLGRSEYRRRPKLQPKPAPNDDHLYPDSVTPSKVDRGLSVRSMSIGLPEGTYDVPYIDDDAFLPRKLRTVQNNHTNGSEDSEVSSEDTIDWFWQSNGAGNSYLDPAHIADTNECVPTPVLIQKVEKKPGKQKKKGDQHLMNEKHGNDPKRKRTFKLCSCVGKQSRS